MIVMNMPYLRVWKNPLYMLESRITACVVSNGFPAIAGVSKALCTADDECGALLKKMRYLHGQI